MGAAITMGQKQGILNGEDPSSSLILYRLSMIQGQTGAIVCIRTIYRVHGRHYQARLLLITADGER